MTTPTEERTRAVRTPRAGGTARSGARRAGGVPGPRTGGGRAVPSRGSGGGSRGAVGRAYARREGRARRLVGEPAAGAGGRSRFVLLVMLLLAGGLVASLWLSTTAAADSYRLDTARAATRDLSERAESLKTDIAALSAAPAIIDQARRMGMVPVSDVARLVPMPDGTVAVVGTPRAATAPAAPVVAAPPVDPTGIDPEQADLVGPGGTPPASGTDPAGRSIPTPEQLPAPQQPAEQQPVEQQPVGTPPAGTGAPAVPETDPLAWAAVPGQRPPAVEGGPDGGGTGTSR